MNIDKEMAPFREQIDALDAQIVSILAKRFEVVKAVAEFKAPKGINAVQPKRAQAVKDSAMQMAQEKGLSPEFAGKIWDAIIEHAHEIENTIIKK